MTANEETKVAQMVDRYETKIRDLKELNTKLKQQLEEKDNKIWHKGHPNHVYGSEWFIAITVWGDKVVLKELPEEYSYDYTTADETYIKRDKIKKWMQFPNSNFIPYCTTPEGCPLLDATPGGSE